MSFLEKFPQNPSGSETLTLLRAFIERNVTFISSEDQTELVHLGFFLLKNLPVARNAVFSFYSKIYHDFIKMHFVIIGSEVILNPQDVGTRNQILDDIHKGFIHLLESSNETWAPILSTWTLRLLGQISVLHSTRPIFARQSSINEVIQVWMDSKGIQTLIDLTSRCLNNSEIKTANEFISILLDTSAGTRPHFDWVVAHVGNSYPSKVVNKVLALGLENFSRNPPEVSQLSSVVGILTHLAQTHSNDVQKAYDKMIQDTLDENTRLSETYILPYLIQLSASSMSLLDVLMDSILPRVKEEYLEKIVRVIPSWIQLHFGNSDTFLALITHIILKSSRGPQALIILLKGFKTWAHTYSGPVGILLDFFVGELSKLFYQTEMQKDFPKMWPCIPLLRETAESSIIPYLIDSDEKIRGIAKQLIILISLYNGKEIGVKSIVLIISEGDRDEHIWYLVDIVSALELKYPSILNDALQIIGVKVRTSKFDHLGQENSKTDFIKLWKNILKIVKTENFLEGNISASTSKLHTIVQSKYTIRLKLSEALRKNLSILTQFIDVSKQTFSFEESIIIVDILASILTEPSSTSGDQKKIKNFGIDLMLDRYLIDLLFVVLGKLDICKMKKVAVISNINKLLQNLCTQVAIQNDALRSLVQTCLNPDYSYLFQDIIKVHKNTKTSTESIYNEHQDQEVYSIYDSLLKENQKRTANLSLSRTHSTSFHSGKFLKAVQKSKLSSESNINGVKIIIKDNTHFDLNKQLFFATLLNVCKSSHQQQQQNQSLLPSTTSSTNKVNCSEGDLQDIIGAMRKVSLMLVEIISPDVMFNGLPWPDEEFSKVQVERDLQIKRSFEEHLYLWDMLEIVANYCPSLCYCSVLLRALMATLMAHWTSCQEAKAKNSPKQLESTIQLINIMKIGQLIPPPLCYIGEILGELKSSEVLFLLKDIWAYMKVNVPVPTSFIESTSAASNGSTTNTINERKLIRSEDFYQVDSFFTEKLRVIILNNVETLGQFYPKFFPRKTSNSSK